jgi:hypothetical protein
MKAEVAVNDAVRVGVRELITDVEDEVDRVVDREPARIADDGRQRALIAAELCDAGR